MGIFGRKKERNEDDDNIHTKMRAAKHYNDGIGPIGTLRNTPGLGGRCAKCGKLLLGSYGVNANGDAVCFKHR